MYVCMYDAAGAGGKADPTRLRLSSLSDCLNDPLAAKLKWRLKKLGAAAEDVPSLFSVEKPVCNLLPLSQEQRDNPQVRPGKKGERVSG
jgi:tRNA A37 threonylcarbamoyladenosine dehydratase